MGIECIARYMTADGRMLNSLGEASLASVVIAKNLRYMSDEYDVGMVLPSSLTDLPPIMKEAIEVSYLDAMMQTYNSPVMDKIRIFSATEPRVWDLAPSAKFLLWADTKHHAKIPADRVFLSTIAPVPEDRRMAEIFAKGLEENIGKRRVIPSQPALVVPDFSSFYCGIQ